MTRTSRTAVAAAVTVAILSVAAPARSAPAAQPSAAVRSAVVAAGPASAFRGEATCFLVLRKGFLVAKVRCVSIPARAEVPPRSPACPRCGALALDLGTEVLPEFRRIAVNDLVADGFGLLVQAELAVDPATVSQFRTAALDRFTAAANHLAGVPVAAGTSGHFDTDRGAFVPSRVAWLDAAGADIVAGLGLLVGAQDPDGDPIRPREAAARFDEAYEELAGRAPVGD